jgi:hypothetical protein
LTSAAAFAAHYDDTVPAFKSLAKTISSSLTEQLPPW